MRHTIIYNSELQIIETKYQGIVTFENIKEISSEIVRIALENDCFLTLGDYRETTLKLSTLEIYQLPNALSEILEIIPYQFKRAIVVARDLEDFYFFETVTHNRGQTAKLFQNIDEAKRWLLGK